MTDMLVVVLFGGRSSEHSISCVTARGVLQAIDRTRYRVLPVGITREGAFIEVTDDQIDSFTIDAEVLPQLEDNGSRVLWPESTVSNDLRVRSADGTVRSVGDIGIVFPLLHGPFGEDGTIQGMMDLLDIPYVGSGVLASAAGMDKHVTKTILRHAGVPVATWQTITAQQWEEQSDLAYTAVDEIGLPVFVKPARAGSSMGVSRVESPDDLADAMRFALKEDSKVLIEAAMVGRELEMGVLQGASGGRPRTSVAGEIVIGGDGFYDFDAKYRGTGDVQLVCPAELSPSELHDMASLAVRAFEALDCRGLARVDFFLTAAGFVVTEVNTMPGFTPISMFPVVWNASGLSYPRLIHELISLGLER